MPDSIATNLGITINLESSTVWNKTCASSLYSAMLYAKLTSKAVFPLFGLPPRAISWPGSAQRENVLRSNSGNPDL